MVSQQTGDKKIAGGGDNPPSLPSMTLTENLRE
jgi:hypothetical protein